MSGPCHLPRGHELQPAGPWKRFGLQILPQSLQHSTRRRCRRQTLHTLYSRIRNLHAGVPYPVAAGGVYPLSVPRGLVPLLIMSYYLTTDGRNLPFAFPFAFPGMETMILFLRISKKGMQRNSGGIIWAKFRNLWFLPLFHFKFLHLQYDGNSRNDPGRKLEGLPGALFGRGKRRLNRFRKLSHKSQCHSAL